jgi:hypothetical protein
VQLRDCEVFRGLDSLELGWRQGTFPVVLKIGGNVPFLMHPVSKVAFVVLLGECR